MRYCLPPRYVCELHPVVKVDALFQFNQFALSLSSSTLQRPVGIVLHIAEAMLLL